MITRSMADYSLYLVTDTGLCRGRELIDVTLQAVRGGVTMVQLREKNISTREFVELARAMKLALIDFNVPLIINDRVDVMAAVPCDGVHVGQSDMHPNDVRTLLGMQCIVGLSATNLMQVYEAENYDIDYIGLGPIFPTDTKADAAPAIGISGLARARFSTAKALVAIGGINEENAESIYKAGANGIAVVSAICSAENPMQAAQRLRAKNPSSLFMQGQMLIDDNYAKYNETHTKLSTSMDERESADKEENAYKIQ